jgi:signal transduction histidine kinase/CheY-like chemotaxis protein
MINRLLRHWNNISIFKKLYGVVGVMALLIAVELFSMLFAMDILSAVRGFVGGEGLWSKAQKDAIQSLHQYALTSEPRHYEEFFKHLSINYGDRKARIEMQKPNPDLAVVRAGFEQGGIHPKDIDGVIRLFLRFHSVSYIADAIRYWSEADGMLDELIQAAADLDQEISSRKPSREKIGAALLRIDELNAKLTGLENDFSYVLGEGSRWLENLLKYMLIFAVLIVECTSLFLTFSFSRSLSRSIKGMSETAQKVGAGDFSKTVRVESEDELGQLAKTINQMTQDLENSIGRRRKAESENQTKSLFLANMSHEIRTPLGVILGLTEALKQPDLPKEEQQRFIETIERTGKDLRQIVNDILDLSKVEAGYLDIEKTRFSLPQFVDDLYASLDAKTIKNENVLRFEPAMPMDDQADVFTDRGRLRQILTNILGNGLKFTHRGSVLMTYWLEENRVFFRITDSGIGMTADQSAQLFQAFSQLDSSTTRRFGGTGLGLFLSKHLARLLGGTIVLERSEPDRGSSFLISVESDLTQSLETTAVKKRQSPHEDKMKRMNGRKILIVDDSAENQVLMQFFLKKWKIDFDQAENGQIAVEKAMTGGFDLVLMDIQMPVMDGYQATQELRKQGFTQPIIALTAHAMKVDRERCLEAGCDEYLTKPIDLKHLQELLAEYLS